jgi:hypothetical protein
MRDSNNPKTSLLVAVAAVALAAVIIACPLTMMAHAQMTQMMGQDIATQGMQGMCPLLCSIPAHSVGSESRGFGLGPLPVYLDVNSTSAIRPIFHPPTLA